MKGEVVLTYFHEIDADSVPKDKSFHSLSALLFIAANARLQERIVPRGTNEEFFLRVNIFIRVIRS
jgi:hypothetical protein